MPGKVLLIEDDQTLLTSYEETLVKEGCRVVKAMNGEEALLKARNEEFDLIITDLNMPKVSGQKFIEILQEEARSIPCPIIISSGFIDKSIMDSFGGHGRIHFLPKPTSAKELTDKVKSLLSKKPSEHKIDVRFINPVLDATTQVISAMTQFTITVGKPYLKPSGEASGDISGVVGVVSSGFKGTISLSFSEEGYLRILSRMLKVECKEVNDENKDGVAELLNIIFGKAKKTLNESGMNIQPAIPSIIRGKGHSIEHHSQYPTIVIPFKSPEIGAFRSEVSSIG